MRCGYSVLFLVCILYGSSVLRAQDSLRNELRPDLIFNVELQSGQSVFAKSIERTPHDELIVKLPDDEHHLYSGRTVARVTYLSTPLEVTHEIPWDSIPIELCPDCFCSLIEGGPLPVQKC
jgi:hypothetical protein